MDRRHGDSVSTFTIITANNGNPASGSAIAYGSDAFTAFSIADGDPNTLSIVGNNGDKILDSVSKILYIYNTSTWTPIAFVTA